MENNSDEYVKPSKLHKRKKHKPKAAVTHRKRGSGLKPLSSKTKTPKVFRCAYGTDIEEDYFLKD